MGRKLAILWHASFSIGAGVLYFLFVLPRWPELMGDTTHSLGNALRIATGALMALAALPVVFTLLRTRKPELGTPQLALSIRVWSIVAHVLAGVLIIGTAISEYWLTLDAAGQYLFAIYGAAAAIGVLGFVAFYLSFVAELPPPPPKPIKAKKPKQPKKRGLRRKKGDEAEEPTRRRDRGDRRRRGSQRPKTRKPAKPRKPKPPQPEEAPEEAEDHRRSRRTAGGRRGADRGATGDQPKTRKRKSPVAGCVTAAPRAKARIGYGVGAPAAVSPSTNSQSLRLRRST